MHDVEKLRTRGYIREFEMSKVNLAFNLEINTERDRGRERVCKKIALKKKY